MPKPRPKASPAVDGTPLVTSNSPSDGTVNPVVPVAMAAAAAMVPPVSMAAAAVIVPPVDDGYFRLRNLFNDCFVIATVNALHACSTLVDNIVHQAYHDDGLMQQLKALFDNPRLATDVRSFRDCTTSAGNQQGDPEDVFGNIFEAMTDEQKALISFKRYRFERCGCLGGQKRQLGDPQFRPELRINLTNVEVPSITFAEALQTTEAPTDGTCDVCGQNRIRWKENLPGSQQRYLKLSIIHPRNDLGQLAPVQITAHKSSAERIIRARWNLISAVEYHPGHYTCLRRGSNNDWVIQNDDRVSHRSRINKYLAGYTALIYERIA
uniref:USP domain-containing protein n=1 Tax=Panagrellus redivivus TaxID=6233 RepID=A0A7E4V745_PANRE